MHIASDGARGRLRRTVRTLVLLSLSISAGFGRTDPPVITSFHGNGTLTWSNDSGTNAFGVEWAPSASGPWYTNWNALDAIVTTHTSTTVDVSMFFRVKQAFSPLAMRGVWMILHPTYGNVYFIVNEDGIIPESAMFVRRAPSGYLTVGTAGQVGLKFIHQEEITVIPAQFTGPASLVLNAPYKPGVVWKVEDVSLCQGRWTGTLSWPTFVGPPASSNLSFAVDYRGLVTNVSTFVGNNIGRMFAVSDGRSCGFFYTGEHDDINDPFNMFRISGTVAGDSFTGSFELDSNTTGSVSLVRF